MKLAQIHRAFWNKSVGLGIIKLHCEEIGVLGFFYRQGVPIEQVDFTNQDVIRYYQAKSRKAGYPLTAGFSVDTDVDMVVYEKMISSSNQVFLSFPEIELEIENHQGIWSWRSLDGIFETFDDSIPKIEYKRCDSLICTN